MYDVVIVGAGPSGLAASLKLAKLIKGIKVAVLEKASSVGGHLVSGAILEGYAYREHVEARKLKSATAVVSDSTWHMTNTTHTDVSWLTPRALSNADNVLVDVAELCQHMSHEAETLGVNVITCCAVSDVMTAGGSVVGVALASGAKIASKHTMLAEGAKGSVTAKLLKRQLTTFADAFALGLREERKRANASLRAGAVVHTLGWPSTWRGGLSGGFVYAYPQHVVIGYVKHMDYKSCHVCPHKEFEAFKAHPDVQALAGDGASTRYGARLIALDSVGAASDACQPGCTIIGCAFGVVNVLKLKGLAKAIASGERAAEQYAASALKSACNTTSRWLTPQAELELATARLVSAAIKRWGVVLSSALIVASRWLGLASAGAGASRAADASTTAYATWCRPQRDWGVADNRDAALTLSGLKYAPGTSHIKVSQVLAHKVYDLRLHSKMTAKFCPAGVYSWHKLLKHYEYAVRHENCLQCKACCAKTAKLAISWAPAPAGGGPSYTAR